jgi:glycosyltransferase involved in cell wall biosynthesis
LNLLVLDQFAEPGGAQLCIRDLLPAMRERGWRIYSFVPSSVSKYANGRKTAWDVLRYPFDLRRARAAIEALSRRHSIDLVLANGPRVLPATMGTNRPTVFYAHSVLRKWYARILAGWSCSRNRAMVIAASQYAAGTFQGLLASERIQVIYSGVADPGFGGARRDGPPRIGLIGRIAPEKGQLDFVKAASMCRDARFLIYGAAMIGRPDYERRVRAAAGGAPVEFRGWVDDPAEALRDLDIVAVPSIEHDAAPRVVLEALASGKPTVAYPSGGIPELIEHGKTGILTQEPTPQSLAGCLKALLGSPEQRAKLASNARRAWHERFRLERYQREVCDLLERAARTADSNRACK